MHDELYYAEMTTCNDMKSVVSGYDNIIKETEAYIKDLKKLQQQLEWMLLYT